MRILLRSLFIFTTFLFLAISNEKSFYTEGIFQWGSKYNAKKEFSQKLLVFNKFFRQSTFEYPYFTNNIYIHKNKEHPYLAIAKKSLLSSDYIDQEYIYISFQPSSVDSSLPSLENSILHKTNILLQKKNDENDYVGVFSSKHNGLWIYPNKNTFFSSQYSKKTNYFNLFMRFQTEFTNVDQNILSKGIYKDGKQYKFLLGIRNQKVEISFKNILQFTSSPIENFVIQSNTRLKRDTVYNIYFTYSYEEHAFILMINQKIDSKYYLKRFSPKGQISLSWSKYDYSPIVIGSNFTGLIDELLLSSNKDTTRYLQEILSKSQPYSVPLDKKLTSHTFKIHPNLYISKVYHHIFSGSNISQAEIYAEVPLTSSIKFFIRSSDNLFRPSISEKKMPYSFFYLEGKKKQIFQNKKYNMKKIGKYFQWKILLSPSFDGAKSPKVFFMIFETNEFLPPGKPQKPTVVSSDNKQVTLRFIKSTESNILNGGRYHIFYGLEPYKADGAILYQNIFPEIKPIISSSTDNYINVTISNKLIIDHIAYTRSNPKIQYKYPLLQNDLHYFFWLTVCDNLWDPINYIYNDHESDPSEYVSTLIKENISN